LRLTTLAGHWSTVPPRQAGHRIKAPVPRFRGSHPACGRPRRREILATYLPTG